MSSATEERKPRAPTQAPAAPPRPHTVEDHGATPDERDPWLRFLAPADSRGYFNAWIEIICASVRGATTGALLLRDAQASQLLPIATWPPGVGNLAHLSGCVEQAVGQRRGIILDGGETWQLAYPIVESGQTLGAVVIEARCDADQARAALRQIHWGLGWVVESLGRREHEQSIQQAARLAGVMDAVAATLRPVPLRELLHGVAGDVAQRLGCARVAIGLVSHQQVRMAAISDTAWIERSGALAEQYRAMMEEALDAGELIHLGAHDTAPHPAHAAFVRDHGASDVVSCPLTVGVSTIAVIGLEWQGSARACTREDLLWLRAFAALAGPIIEDRRLATQGMAARAHAAVKALGTRLFGPRHLVWKAATALLVITIAALALIPVPYRVTGKTVIEGQTVRTLGAPFDGFIAAGHARAGDSVRRDQLLAELDDRDIRLELAKAQSEKDQHERKLREALAAREMSAVQISEAQIRQAQSQIDLASEKITRARIVAPFDAIVISGDLSQLTGAPAEQGKKLFEIAPLEGYRVIVQVDERDIRHVQAGQQGHLLVAGIAADPLPFTVTKVTPLASAQDGKNTFRVEARLDDNPERLRPGMEGVGKIVTARQSLWWVLTHAMADWLRLSLWSWLP